MNSNAAATDFDIVFRTLRLAARHIVAELDLEILYSHALEMLSDFSQSKYLSMLLLNENNDAVKLVASLINGKFDIPNRDLPLTTTLQKVLNTKKSASQAVHPSEHCFFLNIDIPANMTHLTCLPLIGTKNKIIGFISYLNYADRIPQKFQEEALGVLTTLIATTIENARLFQLATLDGLTGLYARRYFDRRLQEEITRLARIQGDLSLIMFDIDHFKIINDTYGHQEGDYILQELAELIRQSLRKDLDIPSRYGGEEFAIILPGTDLKGAIVLAERMRHKCEIFPYHINDKQVRVTISGGIAAMNHLVLLSKEKFIKIADDKLYLAKNSGRNCIRY